MIYVLIERVTKDDGTCHRLASRNLWIPQPFPYFKDFHQAKEYKNAVNPSWRRKELMILAIEEYKGGPTTTYE